MIVAIHQLQQHGFEAVVLGREIQRYADFTGEFLGFGHWNQAGHALGVLLIARQLCGQ